jgi:diacylglycerol O-acyltransferase
MIQLAPLDSVFLSLETPETPSQIGGLAILDPTSGPTFDFERFRDFVAERIALCPRFTWRVQQVPFGLDDAYWVDFPEFDVRDHVHRAALPEPGGPQELSDLAGRLFAAALPKDRPLWDMVLIEGLQGGRVALLWKANHCLMDGESGAGLVELLFDLEAVPAAREPSPVQGPGSAGPPASLLQMARRGASNAVRRNLAIGRQLRGLAASAVSSFGSGPVATSASAPRVSFNGVVSGRRAVAWTSVSLAHVLTEKERFGVSVNDVILSLTSGAVRRYLEERSELPEESLHALMPVSTRAADDDSVGNQVSEVAVHWATDVEDPVERLLAIQASTRTAKHAAKDAFNLIGALAESMPPALTSLVTRAGAVFADQVPLPGNAVVSNVRMTPFPLFITGARIVSMIPMSVLAPTQGLNITAITYCDEIHFGITADPARVSEPWRIADAIPKALGALQQAEDEEGTCAV